MLSAGEVVGLLCGLAAKPIVIENGATLLRCELVLYLTKPTHPQNSNAIYDLADLFGCVFWQRGFHFDANGKRRHNPSGQKKPQQGRGDAWGWGF